MITEIKYISELGQLVISGTGRNIQLLYIPFSELCDASLVFVSPVPAKKVHIIFLHFCLVLFLVEKIC